MKENTTESGNPVVWKAMTTLAGPTSLVALLVAVGCGSGSGGQAAPASAGSLSPTNTDSSRAEAVNREILSRASADSLAAMAGTPSEDYRIGPEDELDILVFGAERFSGAFRVDPSGEIALPLLGSVPASGSTTRELEDTLETRLAATYMHDPQVTVRVTDMQSHGVSVMGAVNQPGVYQVAGQSTLLQVLAEAQGLSEEAGNRVYVVRPGKPGGPVRTAASMGDGGSGAPGTSGEVLEVDLGDLLESGRAEQNVVVRAGDIVQVRPAGLVYVVGEVNRPGGFSVPPGRPITVLQALAMAEGLGDMAAADRGMIVREHDGGSREEIPVNLDEVLEGSEAPPTLAARDVLFVPKNGAKSFTIGVVNTLVRMVTFRGLVN